MGAGGKVGDGAQNEAWRVNSKTGRPLLMFTRRMGACVAPTTVIFIRRVADSSIKRLAMEVVPLYSTPRAPIGAMGQPGEGDRPGRVGGGGGGGIRRCAHAGQVLPSCVPLCRSAPSTLPKSKNAVVLALRAASWSKTR